MPSGKSSAKVLDQWLEEEARPSKPDETSKLGLTGLKSCSHVKFVSKMFQNDMRFYTTCVFKFNATLFYVLAIPSVGFQRRRKFGSSNGPMRVRELSGKESLKYRALFLSEHYPFLHATSQWKFIHYLSINLCYKNIYWTRALATVLARLLKHFNEQGN